MTPTDDTGVNVMAQADALMRRHRVFLAGGSGPVPTHSDLVTEASEDDLPVLTDVVAPGDATGPARTSTMDHALAVQREQIAASLAKWLDEELPQAVLRVVDGFSDKLIAELVTQARAELLPKLQEDRSRPDEAQEP